MAHDCSSLLSACLRAGVFTAALSAAAGLSTLARAVDISSLPPGIDPALLTAANLDLLKSINIAQLKKKPPDLVAMLMNGGGPLYMANPVALTLYGRTLIGTLEEREGGNDDEPPPDLTQHSPRAWGRFIGFSGEHDASEMKEVGKIKPVFDYTFGAFQAGVDLWRIERPSGHSDRLGVYAAQGHADLDVTHNPKGAPSFSGGGMDFKATSAGGYWTHFGPKGWHLDTVVQATNYDLRLNANMGLPSGRSRGAGFAASLEGGYPFHLGGGWKLEPQAQIIYQTTDMPEFSNEQLNIRYGNAESLYGRAGLQLSRSWKLRRKVTGETPEFKLLARADVTHDFLGKQSIGISSLYGDKTFQVKTQEPSLKLSVGAEMKVRKKMRLFGTVSHERTFVSGSRAWQGVIGIKFEW